MKPDNIICLDKTSIENKIKNLLPKRTEAVTYNCMELAQFIDGQIQTYRELLSEGESVVPLLEIAHKVGFFDSTTNDRTRLYSFQDFITKDIDYKHFKV